MSMFDLTHKVAIVTGSLGLLGKEHCLALLGNGATVVVADLDGAAARNLAGELAERFGGRAVGLGVDVGNRASVVEMTREVLARFDRVDVLVNNAAVDDKVESPELVLEQSRFENYPLESWERLMRVNLTGAFLCAQSIAPAMVRRGSGSIINVASTYGIVAPNQDLYLDQQGQQRFFKSPAYPVSKAGLLHLTRYLAAYYGRSGVRANSLSPGGVANGQNADFQAEYASRVPLGRMANKADYRGALVFLASDESAYMTGANLVVDGGWTAW
ncbi:MAG: SDR family oxidoreductase [Polyangiaceae bacterium]|nr:SDR family oxidoreductase [Polyangiaceae bacterium]